MTKEIPQTAGPGEIDGRSDVPERIDIQWLYACDATPKFKCEKLNAFTATDTSPQGDHLVIDGDRSKLVMANGEFMTIASGKITTWNAQGEMSTQVTDIMTGRKPDDYGTDIWNNGVQVSRMVDGSTQLRFPSGTLVSVINGRPDSITYPDGSTHDFPRPKPKWD